MAWTFSAIARTERAFQNWQSLVTLLRSGVPTSFFIDHGQVEPTQQQITDQINSWVTSLNNAGATMELVNAIENNVMPSLEFQTAGQLASRFRAMYRSASKADAAKMAYWLIERLVAGDVTDAQIQNVFGMTAGEYTIAKAKFQTLHDNWASVLVAIGS